MSSPAAARVTRSALVDPVSSTTSIRRQWPPGLSVRVNLSEVTGPA
ncbi:Uncharacterised protein [Mycobacteroides abscessus subsp. abscessus]|nr:Uncharacterised protein [Mycobacteroides abscessus subsp. abscessus]